MVSIVLFSKAICLLPSLLSNLGAPAHHNVISGGYEFKLNHNQLCLHLISHTPTGCRHTASPDVRHLHQSQHHYWIASIVSEAQWEWGNPITTARGKRSINASKYESCPWVYTEAFHQFLKGLTCIRNCIWSSITLLYLFWKLLARDFRFIRRCWTTNHSVLN